MLGQTNDFDALFSSGWTLFIDNCRWFTGTAETVCQQAAARRVRHHTDLPHSQWNLWPHPVSRNPCHHPVTYPGTTLLIPYPVGYQGWDSPGRILCGFRVLDQSTVDSQSGASVHFRSPNPGHCLEFRVSRSLPERQCILEPEWCITELCFLGQSWSSNGTNSRIVAHFQTSKRNWNSAFKLATWFVSFCFVLCFFFSQKFSLSELVQSALFDLSFLKVKVNSHWCVPPCEMRFTHWLRVERSHFYRKTYQCEFTERQQNRNN